MKTRNGFVSNSSSSSFVILIKDTSLSEDELIGRSMEEYKKSVGTAWDDVKNNYYTNKSKNDAIDNTYVLLISPLEYDAEESVTQIVVNLLEKLNFDKNNIILKLEE